MNAGNPQQNMQHLGFIADIGFPIELNGKYPQKICSVLHDMLQISRKFTPKVNLCEEFW